MYMHIYTFYTWVTLFIACIIIVSKVYIIYQSYIQIIRYNSDRTVLCVYSILKSGMPRFLSPQVSAPVGLVLPI